MVLYNFMKDLENTKTDLCSGHKERQIEEECGSIPDCSEDCHSVFKESLVS